MLQFTELILAPFFCKLVEAGILRERSPFVIEPTASKHGRKSRTQKTDYKNLRIHSPPLRNASPVSRGITRRGKIPLRPTNAEAMTEYAQISTRSMDVHDQSQALTESTNLTGLLHAASCCTRPRRAVDGRCGLEPTAALAR